ncbi:hypothetical protein MJD09_15895 [bacterium]|nr:hypothetical protein [bacterium]
METHLKRTVWILGLAFLSSQGWSQSLSARFSTSFYTWERFVSESESQNHLRVYQTARLTIGRLANNRLSFYLFGQGSQDIAESADADPSVRLYNAYFQWRERRGIFERIKLGRQRIYSGVAYGTIDGIDLGLRMTKHLKVGGFAGLLVLPSNEIEVSDWDDSHTFGLRASTRDLLGAKILVSYMQRNRRPAAYTAPGVFTQRILKFESLAQRLVGIDVYRRFGARLSAYGRFDYDLEQERMRRGHLELRLKATTKWEFSTEFFHRAPLIAANSIFTVFEQNTTQDITFRTSYRLDQDWFLSGNAGLVRYEGDETVRFGLGLRFKYGYLGYNFRRGYGGQNNGAHAALNYPLTPRIGLIASTSLSRYRLFDESASDNTSLTGSVGFNYRPSQLFSVDFLGQGVRNRFLSNDFRFFLKANYWIFSKRTGG